MRRGIARVRALALALSCAAAFSCSGKPPEILAMDWRICLERENDGALAERLSLMCAVRDDDGYKDLEYLYLISDDREAFWKLPADSWRAREIDGQTWIGSEGFADPDGRSFGRGTYRVVLIDKGGDRHERKVVIQAPSTEGRSPPTLAVEGEDAVISGDWAEYELVFHDRSGAAIRAAPVKPPRAPIAAAWGGADWRRETHSLSVLGMDDRTNTAARSAMTEAPAKE